jgi:DnaJ like chaperone protein
MGGILGWMVGGPIGAIIGAVIGNKLGDGVSANGGAGPSTPDHHQAFFLATTFALLGKLAKADGEVSPAEVNVAEEFIRDHLNLNAEQRRFAIGVFNQAKDNDTSIHDYARQFAATYRQHPRLRETIYRVLVNLALADGRLHPTEKKILQDLTASLGLDSRLFELLLGQQSGNLDAYYKELGCSPDASDEELKHAYRSKCKEYHPDKLASKGLPDSFLQLAEEQMKQINVAYDAILKERGSGH